MTWLLAVVLRPVGALLFFGSAAVLALLLRPLIPSAWQGLLYDRTIRKRNPWKFFAATCVGCYGVMLLVAWWIGYL